MNSFQVKIILLGTTYPKSDKIGEVILPLGKREVPEVFVYLSPPTIAGDGEIRA